MINAFAYFPSMVYRDEKPEWVVKTKNLTEKYFNDSNNRLVQTEDMTNDSCLNFLKDYLLSSGFDILSSQGYDMQKYNLFITALWGQEVKNNVGTDVHLHKHSQLCGWYFLETTENGSYPIFYDTRMYKDVIELDQLFTGEITTATPAIHFNNVIPGTILFANSWMKHQLTPSSNNQSTKTLHFMISHGYK